MRGYQIAATGCTWPFFRFERTGVMDGALVVVVVVGVMGQGVEK